MKTHYNLWCTYPGEEDLFLGMYDRESEAENALEFLDNVLPRNYKARIQVVEIPLIDSLFDKDK